ncbi:MAG: large conductance mechanosensitive channel protein MscL [Clostridia bacterium]|nr:large conductance mechanosensitive channel protein MscL [Clostridia bacterium]
MSKKRKEKKAKKIEIDKEKIEEHVEVIEKKTKTFWKDFKTFVAKGSVMDIAIGIVVGAAFNALVNIIVSGLLTPLTSILIRTDNLADLKWVLRKAVEADEEAGIEAVHEIAILYGAIIQATINFLIIALSIFVAVRVVMRIKKAIRKKEIEAAERIKKEAEEKKKAEAEAEAARLEAIKTDFINNVKIQADVIVEIKEILESMKDGFSKNEGPGSAA